MTENEIRVRNSTLLECALKTAELEATIQGLVRLVDELRQPFNNSSRHDLYLKATEYLNKLEDKELI
jgi:hypothetical protein